jgi:hypothetical protein
METLRTRYQTAAARRALGPLACLLALLALSLAGPGNALARGGPEDGGGGHESSGHSGGGHGGDDRADRPEVRVSGMCGRGASSKLKLQSRGGAIEAEFEINHHHRAAHWRIVVVQERRIVWRGRERTSTRYGSLSVERRLSDLPGSDEVMARAIGPRGLTCQATAVLPGS